MQTDNILFLAGIFAAAGLYMAVQEALEATVTADMVPERTLATGYGALGTVNGAAKFVSSSMVGLIWTVLAPQAAFAAAALLMVAGTLVLARSR